MGKKRPRVKKATAGRNFEEQLQLNKINAREKASKEKGRKKKVAADI